MAVERVLLVRHGETDWNAQGKWQGFEPTALNEKGRQQAQALAEYLRGRPIKAVYASDLPRAWETATIISEALGLTAHQDERWREHHLGIFQGLTLAEITATYAREWESWRTEYYTYEIPKGESRNMLIARAHAAWEMCVSTNGDADVEEIAIVTHGGTIRALLLKLFEARIADVQATHIRNTSITTIERREDGWHLLEISATPHLSDVVNRDSL
ncbi:MAG: histidine phosphatase family protein [Burkholderiales bacterium]|nr:histidine phosphatase family protein [Anaerolineae bacterium]